MKNISARLLSLEKQTKSIERVTIHFSDGTEQTISPCNAIKQALEVMSMSSKDQPCPIAGVSGDSENNLLTAIILGEPPCFGDIEPPCDL